MALSIKGEKNAPRYNFHRVPEHQAFAEADIAHCYLTLTLKPTQGKPRINNHASIICNSTKNINVWMSLYRTRIENCGT